MSGDWEVCLDVILSKAKNLNYEMFLCIYYVYILTNKSKTLYTGVTNDLVLRVYEHKHKLIDGFTKKYNITQLAYFEETGDARSAFAREKQIKG